MIQWIEEYAKHTALNLGQTLHGVRYLLSHPDIDRTAPRGSLRHAALSGRLRLMRVFNDLFFALAPPHLHHTRAELGAMRTQSLGRWFQCGYGAWRFTENGELKPDVAGADPRWDPRCLDLD